MKLKSANSNFSRLGCILCAAAFASLSVPSPSIAGQSTTPAAVVAPQTFASPELAVDALVAAAAKFDTQALTQIFGSASADIAITSEPALDRKHAADFTEQVAKKKQVSVDPKSKSRAFLLIGEEEWPFPVPLVKTGGKWSFDGKAGKQELLYRRIGSNELDAIDICEGYVEAQQEYGLRQRSINEVNEYAQRIISSDGKQDGLAWKNSDGSWGGPIGENIAKAIEQGWTSKSQPYHGYFFKILKGQGPAAHLGAIDFVVKGAMIGGFALVAAPAEYGVTGVRTYIVSHDGIVFEKDLGPKTLDEFKTMELYNPDKSWTPTPGS